MAKMIFRRARLRGEKGKRVSGEVGRGSAEAEDRNEAEGAELWVGGIAGRRRFFLLPPSCP